MSRQCIVAAALVVMVGTAVAQSDQAPRGVPFMQGGQKPLEGVDTTSAATFDAFDGAPLQEVGGLPTPALLTWIIDWLSADVDLPAIPDLPRVKLVPPEALFALRFGASHLESSPCVEHSCRSTVSSELEHTTVALYDDATRTIYLREGWTGTTPAELSVLIHEMVHHLQNLGELTYECAEARERSAFIAQARWLERFGQTLESEFSLDPMTLLVRTMCAR